MNGEHDSVTSRRYKEDWEDAIQIIIRLEAKLKEAETELVKYKGIKHHKDCGGVCVLRLS